MVIKRTVNEDGISLQICIELTAMEQREIYDECQRENRLEDIRNHMDNMNKEALSGYTAEGVADDPELMELILQNFFNHEDCDQAENDVMEECIRTVLSKYPKKKRKAE